MCGLSRMIFPAAMIGLAVSSLSGHPLVGWLAAGVVAAIVYALGRRTPAQACAVVPPRRVRRASRPEPSDSGTGGSCGYNRTPPR